MLFLEVSKRVDISILIIYSEKVSRSGECFHFHIGMRAAILPLNLPKELTSKSYRLLTDCAILQHKKHLLVSARRLAKPPSKQAPGLPIRAGGAVLKNTECCGRAAKNKLQTRIGVSLLKTNEF